MEITMLEPIQKKSLSDAVFEQLRGRIVDGEMPPGTKLPSERVLCEMLQVNRGALREALRRLEQARLIRCQHGGSTRVLDYRTSAGLDLLSSLLFTSTGELNIAVARSVVEMRSALAPDMARLAALRGEPATAARLDALVESMRSCDGELEKLQDIAQDFWGELAAASDNVAYRLAYNTLIESYRKFSRLLTHVMAEEYVSLDHYADIADAVHRGDGEAAMQHARSLTHRGGEAIKGMLDTVRIEGQRR